MQYLKRLKIILSLFLLQPYFQRLKIYRSLKTPDYSVKFNAPFINYIFLYTELLKTVTKLP